jgi:hypothetical protein
MRLYKTFSSRLALRAQVSDENLMTPTNIPAINTYRVIQATLTNLTVRWIEEVQK